MEAVGTTRSTTMGHVSATSLSTSVLCSASIVEHAAGSSKQFLLLHPAGSSSRRGTEKPFLRLCRTRRAG